MIKKIIMPLLFTPLFSYAGSINKDNEYVEINKLNKNEYSAIYCFDGNCSKSIFDNMEFSSKMDQIVLLIEKIYEDEDFYNSHVKQSYDNYKIKNDKVWVLNFFDVLTFTVQEEQYNQVIKSKENVTSMLYSFYKRINSEESMDEFEKMLNSDINHKKVSDTDFIFYKSISRIMLNNAS
jgi:hypothetical protein